MPSLAPIGSLAETRLQELERLQRGAVLACALRREAAGEVPIGDRERLWLLGVDPSRFAARRRLRRAGGRMRTFSVEPVS